MQDIKKVKIFTTLSTYVNQSLARDRFEILLYVNHPVTDPNGNPTSAQETLDEIARFRADYPDMPIKVMYEELPRSEAKIGLIRKYLNDAIIKRSLDRTVQPDHEIMIVSNDADTIAVSDIYLENFLERFKANPNLDAMLGQLDWDNEAFLRYPELHVGTRLFLYQNIMFRRVGGLQHSSGGNFSMRMKNFAAIGGYNPDATLGEDSELGQALHAARHGSETKNAIGFGGNAQSRLETSARRAIYVFETFQDAPLNQWSHSFSADDDAVRKLEIARPVPDITNAATRAQIVTSTENVINRTIESIGATNTTGAASSSGSTPAQPLNLQVLERSISLCGIDFLWNPDGKSIRITNADRLFKGIETFRKRHARGGARGPSTYRPPRSTSSPIPSVPVPSGPSISTATP